MSKAAMNDIPLASGIYKITCTVNNMIYLGSAVNLQKRKANHFSALRRNGHHNPKLQSSWNKYGEQAFTYEVVELVLSVFLIEREQYWLDALKPFGKIGFNLAYVAAAPMRGRKGGKNRKCEKRVKPILVQVDIYDYCKRLGWDITELSRQADIDRKTAGKAWHGQEISTPVARKIAQALSAALNENILVGNITGLNIKR